MHIHRLDSDEHVSSAIEFQRHLSRAATIPEVLFVTAVGMRDCFGVTSIGHAIAAASPDAPMVCRPWIRLDDGSVTAGSFERELGTGPGQSIEPGTLIDDLVRDGEAKVARELTPADDPILGLAAPDTRAAMVVPLVSAEGISEWLILCWDDDDRFADADAGVVVTTMNMVGRAIDQMRARDEIATLNASLDAQLKEVAKVQRSILPVAAPKLPGYEIATYYQPCDAAGGDYYDFRRFDSGLIGCMVADVSGHGPGAAVVMAMMRTAMASSRLHAGEPGTTVRYVNTIMHDGLEPGTFVTALFVAIDPKTGSCLHASAGHPPPRIVRCGGSIEIPEPHGCLPLGIIAENDTEGDAEPFVLQPGDRLVMHTDGVNEAASPARELFGFKRFDALLEGTDANEPASATLDRVVSAVRAHEAGGARTDDQCVVLIRRLPA